MIGAAGPLTSGPTGCASSFWLATSSSAARRHDGLINPHAVLRGLAPCWCFVAVAYTTLYATNPRWQGVLKGPLWLSDGARSSLDQAVATRCDAMARKGRVSG